MLLRANVCLGVRGSRPFSMYHKERSQKYYVDVDRCSLLMYIDVYIFDLKVIFKCHTLELLLEQGMHNTHIYILPTFIGDKCPNI